MNVRPQSSSETETVLPDIRLRPAGADDIPFILEVEAIPGHAELVGSYPAEVHLAKMERGDFLYLIVLSGDEAVGFVVMRRGDAGSGVMCMHRIAMARTGQGLGRRVVQAVVDWSFADPEIHRVWLDVLPDNARAVHVYERAGFRREGLMRKALRRPDGRCEDLLLMAVLREDFGTGQA